MKTKPSKMSAGRKATATRKRRQVKRKLTAAGKTAAITKSLDAAKRSAAGKKARITKALTDAKRTAAAKWAWVTRQSNANRAY